MTRPPGLTRTLALLSALTIAVVTAVALVLIVRSELVDARQAARAASQRIAALAPALLINPLVTGDWATAEQVLRQVNADRSLAVIRLAEPADWSGASSAGRALDVSPPPPPASAVPAWFRRWVRVDLVPTRTPIAAGGITYAELEIQPSSHASEEALWGQVCWLAGLAAAEAALLTLVIWWLLRRGLRPLAILASAAQRLGGGDFAVRVSEVQPSELEPTARAFNRMATDLERLILETRQQHAVNRRLALIVEQTEEAILTIDQQRRITSANRGAELLLGRSAAEMAGSDFTMLFASAAASEAVDAIAIAGRLLATRLPQRFETDLERSDGRTIEVACNASLLAGEQGLPDGHIVILRDITLRRRAEVELRRAKDAAESANQAKSMFLANMSHEIRTPMNGVLGMAQLLMDSRLDAEQRSHLTALYDSGQSLLQILNDILDFSKIEAGQLALEAIDFSLPTLVDSVLRTFQAQANAKKLSLHTRLDPGLPERVLGDPTRLRQVLLNLVSNAIKFTGSGSVAIVVGQVDRSAAVNGLGSNAELLFSVTDTGIGIAADVQELLFDPFTQAENSHARRYGGTGLGLAICRQLVRLMGGEIEVDSSPGHGATFRFHVPLVCSAASPASGPLAIAGVDQARLGGTVLLVEDNTVNAVVARTMLEGWGLQCTVAGSGIEAIESFVSRTPSIVLMDCQMPGMDGFEATRQIRLLAAADSPRVPIIALTANALEGDRERCLAAGMDDYLPKPFDPKQLRALLARWLNEG